MAIKKATNLLLISYVSLVLACQKTEITGGVPIVNRPNILLIIADDMGKDATSGFSEGHLKPNTPNIDQLRIQGLSFINNWVYPTCSPTRAAILTGKYGYRTGVKWAGDVLNSTETSLQQYINQETNNAYTTALIGKWHLSGNSNLANPKAFGIDYFSGILSGGVPNYYSWPLIINGQESTEKTYATEKLTDLSIDWVNEQDKPWFLWLAYNAPHTPFHSPPESMHTQGVLPEYEENLNPLPYYMAAIEAMDYQIGRLLANIPEEDLDNTLIIFIGDNGSPNEVAQEPYSSNTAKGTLYQGGVNTPLFIAGKGVNRQGQEDHNLISSTDLFATIAEIAGLSVSEINDSKSFKSLLSSPSNIRTTQYSERLSDQANQWAIANSDYKLISRANGRQEFYHLTADAYESNNLLNSTLSATENSVMAELEAELAKIRN